LIAEELINVTTCPGVMGIRVVRVPMVVILAPYVVQRFESYDVAVLGEIEAL
jgi:F0F1-type ATP synthase epsilon subunit